MLENSGTAALRAPASLRLLRKQALGDGTWVDAGGGKTFDVTDPATGQTLASVPAMGVEDARRAIEAAAAAQPGCQAMTAITCGRMLRRRADLVLEAELDHAELLTKPIAEARAEVRSAAAFLEWFGEESKRAYGDTIPSPDPSKRLLVLKQAVGVCAGITPWNFPLSMVARKVAPAIGAGCAFVLKPAEQAPLSALAIASLGLEAALPAGTLNVLTVDDADAAAVGLELTTNVLVRKVTFTGSTKIGKLLMEQSAGTIKKISLELGGNAPFIIFDDADLRAAVAGTMTAKLRNAGQTCISANRILVADGIYDEFDERPGIAVSEPRVGPGARDDTDVGPLIDEAALDKAQQHVDDAVARGGRIAVGGLRHESGGRFFAPIVISDVPAEALLANEETFAPVAGLIRFSSEQEAVALATATQYGLAAYIYTRDVARSWRVAEALEYGMVGLNTSVIATESAPFGGVMQSGIGRKGSRYGLDEFLVIKCFAIGGLG